MGSKQYMLSKNIERVYVEPISALIGSFTCCIIRNPFERIKQLVQVGEKVTVKNALSEVINKEGINGFYKGFSALCIRELPFDTMQMLIFQTLSFMNFFEFGTFSNFFNGGIAGGITAFVTAPIDVIKTRMMTNSIQFTTLLQSIKHLHHTEGLKAF